MKRTVLFPYTETLVGGSYISSSLIAEYLLKHSTDLVPRIVLPGKGPNTEIFIRAGLTPEYYGLRQRYIVQIHHSSGYIGKLKGAPAYLAAYRKAKLYLSDFRPDIVHVNDDSTILTWGLAAHHMGIPVIWHVRQEKGNPLLDKIRIRVTDYLILIAKSTGNRFRNIYLPPNCVIYNGVDLKQYCPPLDRLEEKKKIGLSDAKIAVGFIGNMIANKRPEWAVQAGIDILKKGLDAEFILVGQDFTEGVYEKKLRQMVARGGFEDSFHFLGYRNDIPQVMKALDIFLLPSVLEPFGRVIIEAMASGAAVIATRSGGVPEIIQHEKTGILIPTNNYEKFLNAVLELILNEKYRVELAKAASRVVNRFSAHRMGREMLSVYDKILNG